MDNQALKENLERRFNAILSCRKRGNFWSLEMDYINFIGKNEAIGLIIQELARENRIDPDTLLDIFSVFVASNGSDNIKEPLFFSKELEEKYKIRKKFYGRLLEMRKEDEENKKMGKPIFDSSKVGSLPIDEDWVASIQRLHNDILEKLTINSEQNNVGIAFDLDESFLIINGKKVRVQKFSKQYELLRIIFGDKQKDWQYSEIAEEIDEANKNTNNWKKLADVAYAIQRKVAAEIGIKDLFITSNQSIKINPKHI